MTSAKRTEKLTKRAREERLHIRLSTEEKAAIEEAAAASGEDISVWMRRAARELIRSEKDRG